MSDQALTSVVVAVITVIIAQLGAGYIARLRAPSQNMRDNSDAASGILKSAEQLRLLYEEQFKDQQREIDELKKINQNIQYTQLQNQRRILELESQDRHKADKISMLEKLDFDKANEIVSLKQELAAMYDYIALIEKWARENKLSLPNKQRRADDPEAK